MWNDINREYLPALVFPIAGLQRLAGDKIEGSYEFWENNLRHNSSI
jgi:hypothetical protein